MQVNYIILPNSLTVSFNGTLETIKEGDIRYAGVLKAIQEDRLDEIPKLLNPASAFENEDFDLIDGVIYINGKKIPDVITDRVIKFADKGLPFKPLVKFAEKLLKNPSFNSRQMLYKFLEHNGHPITKDGNFIAYKKVRTDFKDCHTGRMDNSVGNVLSMPREEVDDNPNNTCSSGLHVASYNYAKNFSNGHMLEVEINPEDVVAVPNDYNGEKMRVCKYKVVRICESKLEEELYTGDDDMYEVDIFFIGERVLISYEDICGEIIDGDDDMYEVQYFIGDDEYSDWFHRSDLVRL